MDTKRIGQLIKREREKLSISAGELAKEANISDYHKLLDIEKGKIDIKLNELNQISRILGFTISYFLEEQPPLNMEVLWRKCKKAKECGKIANLLKLNCRNYEHLNKLVKNKFRKFNPPDIKELKREKFSDDYEFASNVADTYREKWRLGEYPIRNLIDAIKKENILIFYFSLEDSGSAASILGDFGAAILLNKNNVPWRLPFDISHELFHLITWEIYDHSKIYDDERGKSKVESYADIFAANLLMPERTIKKEIERIEVDNRVLIKDILEIATKFGVSLEALTYRLESLKIFKKDDMQKLRDDKELKDSFWGKIKYCNYLEGKIKELPEEYVNVTYNAYLSEKISKMKLAEYLNKNLGELDYFLEKEYNFVNKEGISIGQRLT